MGSSDDSFCLKWNDFHTSVTASFADLRSEADLFDVTLVCEGKTIMAHKLILSACSGVFKRMLRAARNKHDPTILMWDMRPEDLECLLNFMYHGEVNITQEKLNHFLELAERLQVRGLTSGGDKGKGQPPKPAGNAMPRRVVLPTTPIPPSAMAAAVAASSASTSIGLPPSPKKPKLSDTAAHLKDEDSLKSELEDDLSNHSSTFAGPPVVTEMNPLGGPGGDGVVSDFDSSAYLDQDDDAGLDDRGGLPPLPQFVHDSNSLNTNQIEPVMGPDGSKEFPCVYCDKRYLTRSRLKRHVLDVHEKGEFPCPDCNKVFTSSRRLKDHQRSRYCHGQQQQEPMMIGNRIGTGDN